MKLLALLFAAGALTACSSTGSETSASHPPEMRNAHLELLDVTSMRGEALGLREQLNTGKSVALVFWQSWCVPCRREAPQIEAFSKRMGDEVRVVGVVSGPDSAVDEAAVKDFVSDLELTYPTVRDRSGDLAKHFKVTGTPTIVWIGPDGRVLHNDHHLPEEWNAGF